MRPTDTANQLAPLRTRPGLPRARADGPWLAGTALSGALAFALLAGSLHASRPMDPERVAPPADQADANAALRGDRPLTVAAPPPPPRERVILATVVERDGERRMIRKRPFGYAEAPLAIAAAAAPYQPFDPLAIYAEEEDARAAVATIYDAEVEREVSLKRTPFDPGAPAHVEAPSPARVVREVATVRDILRAGERAVAATSEGTRAKASLPRATNGAAAIDNATGARNADGASIPVTAYAPSRGAPRSIDPLHLPAPDEPSAPLPLADASLADVMDPAALSAALTLGAENVSRVEKAGTAEAFAPPLAREVVLKLRADGPLAATLYEALRSWGAPNAAVPADRFARAVAGVLQQRLGERAEKPGELTVRIAFRAPGNDAPAAERELRRVSVYEGEAHLLSVARTDEGQLVHAPPPVRVDAAERKRRRKAALARSMPTLYDGLMRAALSQGLHEEHARRLVRVMAFDLDLKRQAEPEDRLEVFFSLKEGERRPSSASRVLYAAATVGGTTRRYYRFAARDAKGGAVSDFFRPDGRSPRTFLLREPVPGGRLTSGYGMRRHPKLRYRKMHTGVDWAAPSGTPILSAGAGTVLRVGWAGGYGRQIKIRHRNGYVTSYNHLRRYARGMRAGARVRQGQRIGQVGTSGMSTGPHLHYEVSVDGKRVNPLRIKLPSVGALEADQLAAFEQERDRIDALVAKGRGNVEVAAE